MTRSARLAWVLAGAVLASTPAGASIPGDLENRSRAGLLHVCTDVEPGTPKYVVCDEQLGGDGEYTGSECLAAGLPAACRVDFVGKLRLKGKLLLIQDDQAKDTALTFRLVTGVILEIGVRGKKARLIDLFDGSSIGHWNDFAEAFLLDLADSIAFTNDARTAYTFPSENLDDLGLELRALAQDAWPSIDLSEATAVFTSIVRDTPKKNVDHSDVADPLASAASFKVVIQFARVRP